MPADEVTATHVQEVRRGTVVIACLAMLDRPRYGYELLERLATAGIDVDSNTLYPLLRRLEAQGLLSSEWNTDEPRPRKYYRTSRDGREMLGLLAAEWRALDSSLAEILEE